MKEEIARTGAFYEKIKSDKNCQKIYSYLFTRSGLRVRKVGCNKYLLEPTSSMFGSETNGSFLVDYNCGTIEIKIVGKTIPERVSGTYLEHLLEPEADNFWSLECYEYIETNVIPSEAECFIRCLIEPFRFSLTQLKMVLDCEYGHVTLQQDAAKEDSVYKDRDGIVVIGEDLYNYHIKCNDEVDVFKQMVKLPDDSVNFHGEILCEDFQC